MATQTPNEAATVQAKANPANTKAGNKQSNNTAEIDLVALFYKYLEKLHWILLTALIGAAIAGVIVYFLITPIYQATAKIYIVGSDTTISLTDLQIGSNLAGDYKEVFKNWTVHKRVKERLNLSYSINELSSMISITNPTSTHVLYVSVKSPDPEEAQLIADTYAQVAKEFIAVTMDMKEPTRFEEARKPTSPVTPKKSRDIIIGFLVGALLAMAVITVKFITDDRIRSSEDIAKVGGLATLGLIPLQEIREDEDSSESGNSSHRKHAGRKG